RTGGRYRLYAVWRASPVLSGRGMGNPAPCPAVPRASAQSTGALAFGLGLGLRGHAAAKGAAFARPGEGASTAEEIDMSWSLTAQLVVADPAFWCPSIRIPSRC